MKRLLRGFMALLLCFAATGCAREEKAMETEQTATAIQETLQAVASFTQPAAPSTEATEQLPETLSEPSDEDFVAVYDYIPDIVVELKYATEDNFTGQVIYDFEGAYLRYGTVKKLLAVQEELREQKLSLKIWDAFRPTAAQFALWEICPDPVYVANPNKGFSSHSRGNTVDVTLIDENGQEIEMPTGFDVFSALADRDYSDCTYDAKLNALLLEQTMERCGFKGYWGEWWHFADTTAYPVEEAFQPGN